MDDEKRRLETPSLTEAVPPSAYRETLKYVCVHHSPTRKSGPLTMFDIITALRMDYWHTMHRKDHRPLSPHQLILHSVLHRPEVHAHVLDFVAALKADRFSPADAMCDLYRQKSVLIPLLGLPLAKQKKALQKKKMQDALRPHMPAQFLTPRGPSADVLFLLLLKSLEYWLLGVMRTM